jgi:hypothetical protein
MSNDNKRNIFHKLRQNKSNLLSLFEENNELINACGQAPSPSKDYCQLIMTTDHVISFLILLS